MISAAAAFRTLLPEPFREAIGDGGLVVLVVAAVVGLVVLVWNLLVKRVEKHMEGFLKARPLLPLIIGFGAGILALATGHGWVFVPAVALVGLALFAPRGWRSRLGQPRVAAAQVLVLFLVYGAQEHLRSRENAGRHYYVFLAFDREGHWEADEQISGRSEDYLNSHRALFSGLDVKIRGVPRIVPDDSKNLKTLPYRTADLDKVAVRVMRYLGRSSFCPALVLGTRVNVSRAPRVVLRSALYAVTADTKLRPGRTDAFVLEGDDDMHYFALVSTLKLMQTLRGLSCSTADGVVPAAEPPGNLALLVETEHEVKRRLLEEYHALLDVSDRRASLAPVARDVRRAIDAKQTDDETVQALLDRYVEVEPPAADAERQRRGLLAKPGALKRP